MNAPIEMNTTILMLCSKLESPRTHLNTCKPHNPKQIKYKILNQGIIIPST